MNLPPSKKKKDLAFKSSKEAVDDSNDDDDELEKEEEMALFVKKFKKFMRNRKGSSSGRDKESSRGFENDSRKNRSSHRRQVSRIQCYECQKYGHIASECPEKKKSKHGKRKTKGKALSTMCTDSDTASESSTSSGDEDIVNYTAFMASHASSHSGSLSEASQNDVSDDGRSDDGDNLQNAFDELFVESQKTKRAKLKIEKKLLSANLKLKEKIEENEKLSIMLKEKEERITFLSEKLNGLKEVEGSNNSLVERLKLVETSLENESKLVQNFKIKEEGLVKELELAKGKIKKLVDGTTTLDHLLSIGKGSGDRRGLGYVDDVSTPSSSKTVFIKVDQPIASNCEKSIKGKGKVNGQVQNEKKIVHKVGLTTQVKNPSTKVATPHIHRVPPVQRQPTLHRHPPRPIFVPVCHHCGRRGHIRPRCLELRKLTNSSSKTTFVKPSQPKIVSKSQPKRVEKIETPPRPNVKKEIPRSNRVSMNVQRMPRPSNGSFVNAPSPSNGVFIPTCHHCGRRGHIRPNCFHLRDESIFRYGGANVDVLLREFQRILRGVASGPSSSNLSNPRRTHESKAASPRQEWRPKGDAR